MPDHVLLLGCGAQGQAALHALVTGDESTHVVVADGDRRVDATARRYPASRVDARIVDAADESAITSLMRDADVVVEALPGTFALPMARLAARCGVSLVSSMYLRDPQEQDARRIAATENAVREIARVRRRRGSSCSRNSGSTQGSISSLACGRWPSWMTSRSSTRTAPAFPDRMRATTRWRTSSRGRPSA